jgi:hypothetical protein
VIVTEEAFDELLDRADAIGEAVDAERDDADDDEGEAADASRRQFALAVDRAVKNVVMRKDRRIWYTQTLKRYSCRLHFVRSGGRMHLIACLPLDDEAEDYST